MAELGRLSRLPPGGEGNLRTVHTLVDRHQDDLKLVPLRRVQIVCENHLLRRSVELALRPPTGQRYEEFVQSIRGSKYALMPLPGAQAALAAIDSEMQANRDTIFAAMMALWKESSEERQDSRRMAAAAGGRSEYVRRQPDYWCYTDRLRGRRVVPEATAATPGGYFERLRVRSVHASGRQQA